MKLEDAIKVSSVGMKLDNAKGEALIPKAGARRPYYEAADKLQKQVYIVSYGWEGGFILTWADGTPISRNPEPYYSHFEPPSVEDWKNNRLFIGRRGIDGDFLSNKVFEKDDWEPL
jgi:hypothetical protein